MNKPIINNIKLRILAGQAKPMPPVGPVLGQYGIDLRKFCDFFNEQTKLLDKNLLLNVKIKIIGADKFNIILSVPSSTFYLKKVLNLKKGTSITNQLVCENNQIEVILLYEIAKVRVLLKTKLVNLNLTSKLKKELIKQEMKMLIGSLNSLGLSIYNKE